MEKKEFEKKFGELLDAFPEIAKKDFYFSNGQISLPSEESICAFDKDFLSQRKEVLAGASKSIEVRSSPVHGYGVFAKEDIPAGTLLEEACIIRSQIPPALTTDKTIKDYVFSKKDYCKCPTCRRYGQPHFFCLGLSSIFNHDENPNARWKLNIKAGTIDIKSILPIQKDEEIFVSYGKNYFLLRKFWNNINAQGPKTLISEE